MAKKFSLVLGVVLLVVGLWGLFSGGHAHNLLIFGINMAHNWVHILSGAVGLIAALAGERYAKFYCLAFSGVYGIVTLGGLFRVTALVQFLNLNMADNILYFLISVVSLLVGASTEITASSKSGRAGHLELAAAHVGASTGITASSKSSNPVMGFGVIGFLIGGIVGFLLRPSAFLVGQLPFEIVITRGAYVRGPDQILLVPVAQTSFNVMLAGAIIGAVSGILVGYFVAKTKLAKEK